MAYITRDSGERAEFASGMVRDINDGKPRFSLCLADGVPYDEQLLTRWAMLMERGRIKYGLRNWQNADSQEELDRFRDSALRHMMQWICDEDDEDHAAAVCFNLMGAEYVRRRLSEAPEDPRHQ